MSKHTEGPWLVDQTPDAQGQFAVTGCKDLRDSLDDSYYASYETIALFPVKVNKEENTYTINPKVLANARLIAAAPDLLEACKLFREYLADCDLKDITPYEKVVEAIAKAGGA